MSSRSPSGAEIAADAELFDEWCGSHAPFATVANLHEVRWVQQVPSIADAVEEGRVQREVLERVRGCGSVPASAVALLSKNLPSPSVASPMWYPHSLPNAVVALSHHLDPVVLQRMRVASEVSSYRFVAPRFTSLPEWVRSGADDELAVWLLAGDNDPATVLRCCVNADRFDLGVRVWEAVLSNAHGSRVRAPEASTLELCLHVATFPFLLDVAAPSTPVPLLRWVTHEGSVDAVRSWVELVSQASCPDVLWEMWHGTLAELVDVCARVPAPFSQRVDCSSGVGTVNSCG